jgi:hypothetical protein
MIVKSFIVQAPDVDVVVSSLTTFRTNKLAPMFRQNLKRLSGEKWSSLLVLSVSDYKTSV